MAPSSIVVLGTGGTIAGTAERPGDNIGYRAATLGVDQLVAAVPALAQVPLVAEQVAQLDSKDMDAATWQRLAQRCAHWLAQEAVQGIVVTHGTDTLEETALFLQRVLEPAKPVVLACAMRPATSLLADGPQNLLDAVTVARTPGARGVLAVCAGQVHGAQDVVKAHSYRLDAFSSGEAGPLAVVEEGQVRLMRNWPLPGANKHAGAMESIATPVSGWPRVEIVLNHAGADGALVRALLAHGVDGLVAAGTGNGTLAQPLLAALLEAQRQGVRVVRATRCAQGRVLPQAGDPFPDSEGLAPAKARVALLLQLLAERHVAAGDLGRGAGGRG